MSSAASFGGRLGILECDGNVASQALYLRTLHRAVPHRLGQLVVCARGELHDIRTVPGGTRLPCGIARARRDGVPRADFLTHVAAVHVSADAAAKRGRYLAARLD